MIMIICAFVFAVVIFILVVAFTYRDAKNITRKEDTQVIKKGEGEFTILQLSDIQIRAVDETQNSKSFAQIAKLISAAKPNLIVLVGDQVETNSKRESIALTKIIVAELDKYDIPYAPVFGNHDRQRGGAKELAEVYRNGKNCLFLEGSNEIHGIGNYIVEVEDNGKTLYKLFMVDSNIYRNYTFSQKRNSELGASGNYDYIYKDQIKWYRDNVTSSKDTFGNVINSLMFFHIALPEFRYYSAENSILGEKREKQCNPYINTGLFGVAKELGSTKGIFVGHDHTNNYYFEREGIKLGYGLKTGETSYFNKDLQGGSVIRFNADMSDFTFEHLFIEY